MNTEGATTQERQLSEMLRRVTPEPPRGVTVEDVAFRLANQAGPGRDGRREPRPRRSFSGRNWGWNRRWAPVLAAASVFVVAATSAGAVVGLTAHRGSGPAPGDQVTSTPASSSSSVSPTQTQTPSRPTGSHFPPESVANGMWGAQLINRQTYNQESLVGGGGSLYAISEGYLDRIDPASGQVVNDVPFDNVSPPSPPVVTGSTVWVVSSYAGGDVVLRGYDGQTLAQVASVTVPASGQLSTTAGGVLTSGSGSYLYLAAGRAVAVIDPATRQVIRRISVPEGPVNSVAVSPDGGRLYVSTGSFELRIYNLATGTQMGSSTSDLGNNGGNLVATAGGVWGTVGVGMTEWVWFAPAGNLTRVVRISQGAGGGLDSVPAFSGGAVWIGGSHTLECASPDTGQKLASVAIPTDGGVLEYFSSVAVTGGHAYAYYQNQRAQQFGVTSLTPPSACSG